MNNQKVVITGIGTINPLAHNLIDTWENIVDGTSGIDFLTCFDTDGFDTKFGGEVKNFINFS